ncbi:hypothetical protein [Citreimonas salinaria]|nr:hypothetical protein [Citreimonas salinaria]
MTQNTFHVLYQDHIVFLTAFLEYRFRSGGTLSCSVYDAEPM